MSIPSCLTKLIQYLSRHPSGVSSGRLEAWIDSCRKEGGYSRQDFADARHQLRESGRGACTNGIWWLKDLTTNDRAKADERKQLAKTRRESKQRIKLGVG